MEGLLAFDDCAGEVPVVCTAGPIVGEGNDNSQTFMYTATDACGNAATGTVTYTWQTYCPASIGDRVWHDINGNGVQDEGEPGFMNIPVYLYADVEGNGTHTTLVATVATGLDGLYLFDNLMPGSYVVEVDFAPFAAIGYRQTGDPDYYGMILPYGQDDNRTTTSIALASGEEFRMADFGYKEVPSLAVIGNVVAFTRDGQTVVRWETVESWGTAGFWLERQVGDQWVRISEELLPFPLFGEPPLVYEEIDPGAEAGGTYLWRLVELETSGNQLVYGPYQLTVDGPGRTYADWAALHFTPDELADPAVSGQNADPDGDGLTNWQEFLAGTNPKSAESVLQITAVRQVPEGLELRWRSVAGHLYRIAVADTPYGPYLPLEQPILATDGNGSAILAVDFQDRRMFFRVIEVSQ